jgi:hypothetical protein
MVGKLLCTATMSADVVAVSMALPFSIAKTNMKLLRRNNYEK